MKNQKGISLITLIILVVIIIGVIIFIVSNNQGKTMTKIEWGYTPSDEYYELLATAFDSRLLGSKEGTLSLASFNTLGKDVKKAGGKWFKKSNVNFWSQVVYEDNNEMVTLTDGEHVAIFNFTNGISGVSYYFADEELLTRMGYNINEFKGCKITIK